MQIFWVSGPVGKIHSFNLSLKTASVCCCSLVIALLAIGSALQFFGFRLALEYDPQIARQMGNLHTAVEIESLNAVYQSRLGDLEHEQLKLAEKVVELESLNTRLTDTLVPNVIVKMRQKSVAQGGTYQKTTEIRQVPKFSILDAINILKKNAREQYVLTSDAIRFWSSQAERLESLPLSMPIPFSTVTITSKFGHRIDPINKQKAFHSGIDFDVPMQTPVVAAGLGKVTFATNDPHYGKTIVIHHIDGFISRYAHNNELLVTEGDMVIKGQQIAKSGNTGRSTGPHLHFEIIKNNQASDPALYLTALKTKESTWNTALSSK